MSSPRIMYEARPDATPEAEIATLANVYRFVLAASLANKNAAGVTSTNGDDAMKGSKNDRAKRRIS